VTLQRAQEAAERGDNAAYSGFMEPIMKGRMGRHPDAPIVFSVKRLIADALMLGAGAASLAFVAMMIAVAAGAVG